MTISLRTIPFLVIGALLLTACATSPADSPGASPGASTSPTGTPTTTQPPEPTSSPAPSPSGIESAAQAAALVFASDARFAAMTPLRPDIIGQSAWFEAFDNGSGFTVAITIGSGDCQAGCIERHTWTYAVSRAGQIELVGDEGDDVVAPPVEPSDAPATVTVQLTAGPTCPVETVPPDPNCAPRTVTNAEVVLRDPSGAEVARGVSDESGSVTYPVPGGAYYVEAQTVEGLMGTPEPQAFAVVGGDVAGLLMVYDTGIR